MHARLAALAAALLLAGPAARAESPRIGSFELGAGPYRPNIDSDFTAPGPYRQIFGGGRSAMFRAGVSRALYTDVGQLELGFRTGFYSKSGHGVLASDHVTPSGDRTSFNVLPTSLTLTYRADFIPDRWGVPLAPYVRVALERYNWWVTKGGGSWTEKGATNGWSATAGLALLLDFFDRDLARELDADTGINHTYLFFDFTKSKVDDFGSSKSWDLSADRISWAGGLLFVF